MSTFPEQGGVVCPLNASSLLALDAMNTPGCNALVEILPVVLWRDFAF
jgi:hypothetical protein